MARHYRHRNPVRRSFGRAAVAPWWLWLILAPISYALFAHLASLQFDTDTGLLRSLSSVFTTLAESLQNVIPTLLIVCSFYSSVYRRRTSAALQASRDHGTHHL